MQYEKAMLKHLFQDTIVTIVNKQLGVDSLVVYGSYGRNTATVNSDLDLILCASSEFSKTNFIEILKEAFPKAIYVYDVKLRSKIVLYFTDTPKIEITICENLKEVAVFYRGSNIKEEQITKTVLIDTKGIATQELKNILKNEKTQNFVFEELINKFIYEFESSSRMHTRSDSYQSYFFFNIALEVAIQLHCISKDHKDYLFLPKNFSTSVLDNDLRNLFFKLSGTLFLPNVNHQKRQLLEFFYEAIIDKIQQEKLTEIKTVLETIYKRDFFWNYRDISTYNKRLKSNCIYRGSSPSLIKDKENYDSLISGRGIETIIDLRALREIEEIPYPETYLSCLNYIKAPFDPWAQSEDFKVKYEYGTDIEIAYRFFSRECKFSIQIAVETIVNSNGNVLFHCHAGKDRTGIIATILHLMSGADQQTIFNDYLASGSDTKIESIQIFLNVITEEGGINSYLNSCGLDQKVIEQFQTLFLQ